MKKPVLVLAITAIATFVMGWVAHRVYKNSVQSSQELSAPALPAKESEIKPVSVDSPGIAKDSSLYHRTNFTTPVVDSSRSGKDSNKIAEIEPKEEVLKFIPVKKFSDFTVIGRHKSKLNRKLDFTTCSSGFLYKKEIKQAVEKGAVFAGKFAFAEISCDSNCYSSSIVDLKTGNVYAGPHATTGYKYRIDSRLLYVNPPKSDSTYTDCFDCTPELYVWTGKLFKRIQ